MLRKVRRTDVDNPDEVAKVINGIIDVVNKNEVFNDKVEDFNKEVDDFNENAKGIEDA